jgi:uncharacterized protein involved in exopolysaccharide biosynthesis
MTNLIDRILKDWQAIGWDIAKFLWKKWYILVAAFAIGGGTGYWYIHRQKPTYTSTISFVLSTEAKQSGNLMSLAVQLGYDAGTSGSENIFTGENIIELFKSRKIIRSSLFQRLPDGRRLLDFLAKEQYGAVGFPEDTTKFTERQKYLLSATVSSVIRSFTVFKKNDLVFYYIAATSENSLIAEYVATYVLKQTASYFIDTKTQVAASSLTLLKKETDSLATVLSQVYKSSASVNDQTFNINPAFMSQRSSVLFNQAKATALSAAYIEAVRNLELAKINLQRQTPLFRIIDEPELPLMPQKKSASRFFFFWGIALTAFAIAMLAIFRFILIIRKEEVAEG